jgi:hypothetical protein
MKRSHGAGAHRRPRTASLVGLALAMVAGGHARAETRSVVAGPSYAAGSLHRTLFGDDYRDLWTTPVVIEVLDLKKEAGGLSPVRRVGGQQTKGLAFKGADGRNYTFRGLEKDPTGLLDEDLRGTVVEKLVRDQMAAQHPASEVVARVLLEAAGVPVPAWRLAVLPDDPALGAFQKDFAGATGVFAEYPSAVSATNPGFHGITEILDHQEMYRRLDMGEGGAVDAHALLRARLVDLLMGDWDRHRKQWRWARVPGRTGWQPIPEDRDQAFSRYEGLVPDLARQREPRLQKLAPSYPSIGGLTYNGWDQDRRLLVSLTRRDFEEAAEAVRTALSDAVIDRAAQAMPAEWQRLDGVRLVKALKARRDALPAAAERYYRHLAGRVDVYLTTRSEEVKAQRSPNGDLEVVVRRLDADNKVVEEPSFQRVFHGKETGEVRLYLQDGNDHVRVEGGGGIRLRVIGGKGEDVLDAAGSGDAKLSDSSGPTRVNGAGLDERPYTPPPPPKNAPWIPPRDWGSETWPFAWTSYNADLGVFLGAGLEVQRFGFRKHPYASRHVLRAGYAFGQQSGKIDYQGEFRRENRRSFWSLDAYGSGVEVLRFYGLGNETTNTAPDDFYKASSNEAFLSPRFNFAFGEQTTLSFGPLVKYHDSKDEPELVSILRPYGHGTFAEAGVHAGLVYDTRDRTTFPRKGVVVTAAGTYFPEVWDVRSDFGQVSGSVSAYLSATRRLTLAVRAGGKWVFGDYPYQEAAYIGGGGLGRNAVSEPGDTLRGFRARRFGGDGAVWGNSDLRLRVSRATVLLPANWGVFGFADSGRVFLEGQSSDRWHTGYGGGIWLSFLDDRNSFSAGVAHSREENLFYVKGGFTF